MRHVLLTLFLASVGRSADGDVPPLQSRLEDGPRVVSAWYRSAVLDRRMPLSVVLPEGYDPHGEPVEVVVLLHGSGRDQRTLLDDDATREALLRAPFATVHPAGLNGWYVDSPLDAGPRYQAALTEAIAVADAHFSFRTDRAGRGIGGWSMGGYGAALYAVTFPQAFGALGTLIGCLDFPNPDLPPDQNHVVPRHFGPAAGWPALNPLTRAARLDGMALWHATAADAFDRTMNDNWHRRLTELGYEHSYVVVDGGHTFGVVTRTLPPLLEFFAAALASRAG